MNIQRLPAAVLATTAIANPFFPTISHAQELPVSSPEAFKACSTLANAKDGIVDPAQSPDTPSFFHAGFNEPFSKGHNVSTEIDLSQTGNLTADGSSIECPGTFTRSYRPILELVIINLAAENPIKVVDTQKIPGALAKITSTSAEFDSGRPAVTKLVTAVNYTKLCQRNRPVVTKKGAKLVHFSYIERSSYTEPGYDTVTAQSTSGSPAFNYCKQP